jgi:hypothetical protein
MGCGYFSDNIKYIWYGKVLFPKFNASLKLFFSIGGSYGFNQFDDGCNEKGSSLPLGCREMWEGK